MRFLGRSFLIVKLVIISALSCFSQTGRADFDFDRGVYKFGKVKEGEVLSFTYSFTNKGDVALLISDYKVQCTCTEVDFPKHPIAPGQGASIKVKFDTKGKIGYQDRTIEIISNAKKSPESLRFKGTVDNSERKK